jgi:5S rRNA maturation endonuclease (ribonuclease M5)
VTANPVDIIADALQAAGKKVKWYGDKLTAQCPAHDDNEPSLSVAAGKTRDAVVHCHAGCSPDDVLKAIGLHWTDLGPKKLDGPRRQVARYIYRDEGADPLFSVVRYEPKTFRQERWHNGQWHSGLGDTRRVIYNLPIVKAAAASGETVWICEGEKDADALTAIGLVATCNPMGAGAWRNEYSHQLAGVANVIIVADNDLPGLEHARIVERSLPDANVTIVKAAKGKDAYDHLVVHQLGIDEFVPWDGINPTDAPASESPFVDFPKLFADDTPTEDWVLWPIIPRGRAVSFYAGAKQGKSTILLAIVAAVCTGRKVLGVEVQPPVHVLYLDYEMTRADLKDRLVELGYGETDNWDHLHYALIPSLPPLDTDAGAQACLALAQSVGAEVVVIDTYGRAVLGEEDKADTTRAFYRYTGMALKAAGIAWARLDHSGKDGDKGARGSSAKNDDVDIVWRLQRTEDHVTLTRTHTRVPWGMDRIEIDKIETDDGVTVYRMAGGRGYAAGTKDLAEVLDRLGVAHDATQRQVRAVLKDHAVKAKTTVLADAMRYRRESLLGGNHSGITSYPQAGNHSGITDHDSAYPLVVSGNHSGNHRESLSTAVKESIPPLEGGIDTCPEESDWLHRLNERIATPTEEQPIADPWDL